MAKAEHKSFYVMMREPGCWEVTRGYSGRPLSTHPTQRAAVEAARPLARAAQGDLSIYKRNGNMLTREWYTPVSLKPRQPPQPIFPDLGDKKRERAIREAAQAVVAQRRALEEAAKRAAKPKRPKKTLSTPA